MQSFSSDTQVPRLLKQAQLLHEQGRLREAQALYQQVLAHVPNSFEALHGIGILYGQLGQFEQALHFITRASDVNPKDFSVYYNQGKAFQELRRLDEALISYDKALALKPGYLPAINNRGNILKELNRYGEALISFDKALSIRPDFLEAYLNRGSVLQSMRRYAEALETYNMAIARKPDCADAYYGRGNVLNNWERNEEALVAYETAIALKPDYAEAHNNLGYVLKNLQRYDEAIAHFEKAIALKSDYAEAHNNLGTALKNLKRYDEAKVCYDRAIALKPDYADANFNMSFIKLVLGDYEAGWLLYEWRWKIGEYKDKVRHFEQPVWLGEESPAGRSILLHADQGFGDVIQVARYVPIMAALGARVILEIPSPLVPLLKTLQGTFSIVAKGDVLPAFDLHCPLMSLPLAFKTKIITIPAHVPYLGVDLQKQSAWRERLGPKTRRRVGLAWSGNSMHKNDRDRSIGLRSLQPLWCLDCEYHAVQKEIRREDQVVLAEFNEIQSHVSELRDFSDTAALIAELDLLITVDTSVAHLAGALGKEVWVLLPYDSDFRWLLERNDSPWYPTARLFRQQARGDWGNVIAQVRSELDSELASGSISN